MKFSLKTEYGLKAMIELSHRWGQGPVTAKHIASNQNIPERFLEQQIMALKKAGLVNSQRGAAGGCSLSREPGEISLREIVEALEGKFIDIDCLSDEEKCCSSDGKCALQEVWGKSRSLMESFFDGLSIGELAQRELELKLADGPMYYI